MKDTHGCVRCFDTDMQALKEITDFLTSNDAQEKPGKVTVVDDLVEVDYSTMPLRGLNLMYVEPSRLTEAQREELNKAFRKFISGK